MSHSHKILDSFQFETLNIECGEEVTKGASADDVTIDLTAMSIPQPVAGQTVLLMVHVHGPDIETRNPRGDGSWLLQSNVTWDTEGADGNIDAGSSATQDDGSHFYLKKWTVSDPTTITLELVNSTDNDISWCLIVLDAADADSAKFHLNTAYIGSDESPWRNSVALSTFGLPGVVVPANGFSIVHAYGNFGSNMKTISPPAGYTTLSSDVTNAESIGYIWKRNADTTSTFEIHRPDLTTDTGTARYYSWTHLSFWPQATMPAGDATDPTTFTTFDAFYTNETQYMWKNSAGTTTATVKGVVWHWQDRSAANNDMLQASGDRPQARVNGNQKTMVTVGGNLKGAGVVDFFNPPIPSSSLTSVEFFATIQVSGWRGGSTIATNPSIVPVLCFNSAATINRHVEFGIDAGTTNAYVRAYNGTSKATVSTGTAQPYGNLYVYGRWEQGAASTINWNGVKASGTLAGTSQQKAGGGEKVGQFLGANEVAAAAVHTDYLPGKIMDIGIRYNRAAMSSTALTNLINWAKANYGIVDNPTVGGDV